MRFYDSIKYKPFLFSVFSFPTAFFTEFSIPGSNLSLLSTITPNLFSLQVFGNFIPLNMNSSFDCRFRNVKLK